MQQLKSGAMGKDQGYFSLIMETSKESIEDVHQILHASIQK